MKFVRCHFAIPEQFRGVRIVSWTYRGHHMATARFFRIPGEFDVPEWWLDRQIRER